MTLQELRDEIDRMITAHPEAGRLKVYGTYAPALDEWPELEKVVLHDPEGAGFQYATVEPE
jgi:hypothetical protein